MDFFHEKLLIKFSCTYQPLSFCKITKFLEPIHSYGDVSFLDPKWSICPEQIFLVQTIIITFIYTLALFTVQNLKNSYSRSRVMRIHHFWAQNSPFAPIFFLEHYQYHSHLPISLFHCVKCLKNSSSGSRVIRMCNFWARNGPFPQMRFFSENLLMSLFSFIHAYLQAKNSDINLLVIY